MNPQGAVKACNVSRSPRPLYWLPSVLGVHVRPITGWPRTSDGRIGGLVWNTHRTRFDSDSLDRASAQVMVGYSDSVFDHGIHKQGRKRRMIKLYKVQSEGVKKRVAPGAWPKRIA